MKKTKITHSGYRIGDMRHRIILHVRQIVSPNYDGVDFGEQFIGTERWAAIKDLNGVTLFDGVNQDVNITHEIGIRYDANVTAETFIQLADGRRLRVVNVRVLGERNEYMALSCTERGLDEAAKA